MQNQALDRFLAGVQNRAFVTARLATGNVDEAMDIVQDSMLKLVKYYGEKSAEEWPALFTRVLKNTIRDWYRRQKVRKVLFWWQQQDISEEELDIDTAEVDAATPFNEVAGGEINRQIEKAVQRLPERQQQAFVLRAWWEHSTEETADIMGCSAGSVKTHYSRALKALQETLRDSELADYQPSS